MIVRNKSRPKTLAFLCTLFVMMLSLFITPTPVHAYETQTFDARWYDEGQTMEGMTEWYYWPGTYTYDYVWLERVETKTNGDVVYDVQAGWGGNYTYWGQPYRVTCSNGFSTTIWPNRNQYKWDRHRGAQVNYASGGHVTLKAGGSYTITFEVVNNSSATLSKGTIYIVVPQSQHTVTQIYYYMDEQDKQWHEFGRNNTSVIHGQNFTPWNTTAPAGYAPNNQWGAYPSGGEAFYGTVGKDSFQVTAATNVHVHYVARDYSITYKANGGSGNGVTDWTKYRKSYTTRNNMFSRTGYTFTGWNERSDGKGTSWTSWIGKPWVYSYTTSINLYAQWRANNYTLTVDPNGGLLNGANFGSANGTGNRATVTTTYGSTNYYKLGTANRNGYVFKGFYDAKTGGTKVFNADGSCVKGTKYWNSSNQWAHAGNATVYAQWNKIPTFSLQDFYVIEGQSFDVSQLLSGKNGYRRTPTTDFPDKLTPGTFPVTANDAENGDLTSRIQVTQVIAPNGTKVNNVNTSVLGTYKVTYKVTDFEGVSATATRNITVLPSSTPQIRASDRYFFKGDEVTRDILLARTEATDKYDGVITNKVQIVHFDNINSNIVGDYEITYRVTNTSNKTTEKTVIVHIIDRTEDTESNESVRFIKEEYINTLGASSKWANNQELMEELLTSMRKNSKDEAVKVYKFNSEQIDEVQNDIKNNGFNANR